MARTVISEGCSLRLLGLMIFVWLTVHESNFQKTSRQWKLLFSFDVSNSIIYNKSSGDVKSIQKCVYMIKSAENISEKHLKNDMSEEKQKSIKKNKIKLKKQKKKRVSLASWVVTWLTVDHQFSVTGKNLEKIFRAVVTYVQKKGHLQNAICHMFGQTTTVVSIRGRRRQNCIVVRRIVLPYYMTAGRRAVFATCGHDSRDSYHIKKINQVPVFS